MKKVKVWETYEQFLALGFELSPSSVKVMALEDIQVRHRETNELRWLKKDQHACLSLWTAKRFRVDWYEYVSYDVKPDQFWFLVNRVVPERRPHWPIGSR